MAFNYSEKNLAQKYLKDNGYYSLAIDGDFGKGSKSATLNFVRQHSLADIKALPSYMRKAVQNTFGLTTDTVIGTNSKKAINKAHGKGAGFIPQGSNKSRMINSDISQGYSRKIQKFFNNKEPSLSKVSNITTKGFLGILESGTGRGKYKVKSGPYLGKYQFHWKKAQEVLGHKYTNYKNFLNSPKLQEQAIDIQLNQNNRRGIYHHTELCYKDKTKGKKLSEYVNTFPSYTIKTKDGTFTINVNPTTISIAAHLIGQGSMAKLLIELSKKENGSIFYTTNSKLLKKDGNGIPALAYMHLASKYLYDNHIQSKTNFIGDDMDHINCSDKNGHDSCEDTSSLQIDISSETADFCTTDWQEQLNMAATTSEKQDYKNMMTQCGQ